MGISKNVSSTYNVKEVWGALPSRWLYISNFPTDVNLWRHIKLIFEFYGVVQEILVGFSYAYIIYYDFRDAVKALQFLHHKDVPHNQFRLEIWFSSKLYEFLVASSPGLECRSEYMVKGFPSPSENSTVISSGNKAIPDKNTLDLERVKN
ncbi:4069_t:CDS:2, partial [Racocetra persica]